MINLIEQHRNIISLNEKLQAIRRYKEEGQRILRLPAISGVDPALLAEIRHKIGECEKGEKNIFQIYAEMGILN